MAGANRSTTDDLSWLERLARDPGSFDFHAALRRFEALFPASPRFGKAARPSDEPLRVGQTPSSAFAPSPIASFEPAKDDRPPRLQISFFGLWGPNGALPSHLTEYARDRIRHVGDTTLASFVDVFHHRMLLLFQHAWASAQPTATMGRLGAGAFSGYVGALLGVRSATTRGRDAFPDRAKLFYAGRFAHAGRNAEGLRGIIADYFGLPAAIEEFVGDWIELPAESRWRLGVSPDTGTLGRTAVLGARVWSRNHRFRVVLGPLSRAAFERMLPRSDAVAELSALVRLYTNDEWDWDLRIVLAGDATEATRLGPGARLGWTTRLGRAKGPREDLVVDPRLRQTRRMRVHTTPR